MHSRERPTANPAVQSHGGFYCPLLPGWAYICSLTTMPFGPAPLGFAYFAGAKFVGYSAYSALLNRKVSQPFCKVPNAWKSGLVRTGMGVAVGTMVGLAFWKVLPSRWLTTNGDVLFWSGLIPVRILEWYFFLWLLYRQCHMRP